MAAPVTAAAAAAIAAARARPRAAAFTSVLNSLGVITQPITTSPTTPPTSSNPLVAQLQTDEQALQTELQTPLEQVAGDRRRPDPALYRQPGARLGRHRSQPVGPEAGPLRPGRGDDRQHHGHHGLRPRPSSPDCSRPPDATAATTVFNDLVKIVTDSGVTATDLSTVATDQAAIQTDENNLHNGSEQPDSDADTDPDTNADHTDSHVDDSDTHVHDTDSHVEPNSDVRPPRQRRPRRRPRLTPHASSQSTAPAAPASPPPLIDREPASRPRAASLLRGWRRGAGLRKGRSLGECRDAGSRGSGSDVRALCKEW